MYYLFWAARALFSKVVDKFWAIFNCSSAVDILFIVNSESTKSKAILIIRALPRWFELFFIVLLTELFIGSFFQAYN